MTDEFLRVETNEAVATLTIDRPAARNALNAAVLRELEASLRLLDADPAVRAVILTGAGERAFAAGADIRELLALDVEAARRFSADGQRVMLFIESMQKPVLAAVNGAALGGGLELALACDFIYAAGSARLGLPEVTLGLLPGFGGTQNLARRIGPGRAAELIFTGRLLTAAEALDWDLVNAVYPDGELLAHALESATRIASNGGAAVAHAKRALRAGLDRPLPDGFGLERELFAALFATADHTEGLQAFLDKRKPEFKDKPQITI